MLLFPLLDGGFIALRRLLPRLLHTQTHLPQETTAMVWMIAHPKDALDNLGYPPTIPDLSPIAKGRGSLRQQFWQSGSIRGTESGLSAPGSPTTQACFSFFSASLDPVAHRSFGHSQRDCDVFLFPALLP
jgi:hypothetical protein